MKLFGFLSSGSGGGTSITVVNNYTALLALPPVTDTFYWCENSQGTSWLPGSLGGTYYPNGLYYCANSVGPVLQYIETPYQATQTEVNDGTNDNKFVTPKTLLERFTKYLQFNTTNAQTQAVGKLIWNDTDGALEYGLKGGNVNLTIGQEEVIRVTNDDTVPLTDGMVVYVSGANGSNFLVKRAQANSETTSAETIGVVTETIAVNNQGFITTFGTVKGLNTNAFNNGDTLYLSPTVAGALTNIKPAAPNHLVTIGFCIKKSGGAGEIFVRVDNGYELDELHDVKIVSPVNNQTLVYNSSTSLWENKIQNIILLDSHIGGSNTDNDTFSRLRDVLIPANTLSNGDIIDVEFVVFQNNTSISKTARLHLTQSLATALGTANDIATTPQNLTTTVQFSLYRTLMYWNNNLQLLQLDTATAVTDPVTNVTASTELLWPFDPTVNNWLSISAGSTANNIYTKTLTRSIMRLTKKQ